MAHWTSEVIAFEVSWTNFLAGLGVGFVWAPLNRMVLSKLKGKFQDQGFAMFYLNFDLGYALGTTAIVGLHARYTQINYALLNENISPFNQLLQGDSLNHSWSIADNEGLVSLQAEISRQAVTIAYNNSFMICAILMIMLIPLVFLFRKDWIADS
jgi:DHA2 family multidrug resistance protein